MLRLQRPRGSTLKRRFVPFLPWQLLVFFATIAVAITAHYIIPGFSWPLAFVLGAIVSPPDAVAATSITKGLGLNRRVITIIEGESLVNDASALIAYKYSVATVLSGVFVFWKAGLGFLLVAIGGVLAGLIVGYIMVFAHKKITESPIVETSLSLLTPFVAYILAERFHCSGVLAVVTAGFYINWNAREIFTFQTRLQTNIVWDTVIFVLNGLVFILIGLQMPSIIMRFEENGFLKIFGYGVLVSLVTIGIRIIWVFIGAYNQVIFKRKKIVDATSTEHEEEVSWKNVLIVAWTGSRGVVSLATALALPLSISGGKAFPMRDEILFFAFVVILLTLVVQGVTLPLLIRLLGVKTEEGLQKREEKDLELTLTEKTLEFLKRDFPLQLEDKVMEQVKKIYETNYSILSHRKDANDPAKSKQVTQLQIITQLLSAQLEIVKFQRELLLTFQKDGTFNEESISKAELDLDIEELRINNMIEKRDTALEG